MRAPTCGAALLLLLLSAQASAQGINTNVALPVAEGEGIWRSQLRAIWRGDDPSPEDRDVRSLVAPQTLAYGVTPRLSMFATLPLLARRRTESDAGTERTEPALGDVTLLGRYMVFLDDYAPLSTRRVALLFGVKLPTGADRFGTPSYDPIVGAVATWAANRHELDLDVRYRTSIERQGVEAGNRLRYDAAYRYRLWPARFGGRLLQLNGLIELNGIRMGRRREHGSTVDDSGGQVLFLSPGIQLAAVRWIVEASVQIPVAQHLHGSQPETEVVAVLSVRIPFSLD